MIRLNLGCGTDKRDGYLNVDSSPVVKPDQCVDLELYPWEQRSWPWDDNSVDEVLMWNSLEHLYYPDRIVKEVARILKRGGVFWGSVPYHKSDGADDCLEHRGRFTLKSFDSVCGVAFETDAGTRNGYDAFGDALFEKLSVTLHEVGNTKKTKLRNLFPLRRLFKNVWWNTHDEVHFRLRKR